MNTIYHQLFKVDINRTMYIRKDEIGKEINILHNKRTYCVKIPKEINTNITIRLHGLGKKRMWGTGNLLLHIWVNQGNDVYKSIWVSEELSQKGTEVILQLKYERIQVIIPKNSRRGLKIRLKGLGEKPIIDENDPPIYIIRGDLYLQIFTYPERIFSIYRSFDDLSTEAMALEGWIYIHIEEIQNKIKGWLPGNREIQIGHLVNEFNNSGWIGIYNHLRKYLLLDKIDIQVEETEKFTEPGRCECFRMTQSSNITYCSYTIFINKAFVDNPFTVAAILSHELCHIIYSEVIVGRLGSINKEGDIKKESIEIERTVDLLVFLLNLGEFQLRVARDKRLSLGYFNQDNFERMISILENKGIN